MFRAWSVLAVLVLVGGCTHHHTLKPTEPEQENRVITLLKAARSRVKSIHIRMRAAQYGHGKARKGRMDLFAKGSNLRMEIWSPTDNLLGLSIVCGSKFVYINPIKKTCRRGDAANWRFLPIALPQPQLPAMLAGLGMEPDGSKVFTDGDGFALVKTLKDRTYRMFLNENPLVITSYELSQGKKKFLVEQSRFKADDGFMIPHRIKITMPDRTILMKYRIVEPNKVFEEDLFDCSCPKGFRRLGG